LLTQKRRNDSNWVFVFAYLSNDKERKERVNEGDEQSENWLSGEGGAVSR
jgi:hypothetical protein